MLYLSSMEIKLAFLLMSAALTVYADVYMQNPRGSNNRLNGRGRNRGNANRLFDSQNNARGGYNVGGLKYHVGSELFIEWTNQHSCSGPNNNCELILQYMCDPLLRNGVSDRTIPFLANNGRCENNDCNTDLEYGMHENYENYLHCKVRKRNMGLFTADQDMNGRSGARFTRQERNGNRYGYECNEERDYYPYWHPTSWKDIAVLTSNTSRCAYYQQHSQNVADKYHCMINLADLGKNDPEKYFRNNEVPQTETECKKYTRTVTIDGQSKTFTGEWVKVAAHGIPAPDCQKAPQSRDNHNGNGVGGYPNTYNWTIPNDVNENCALRLRYNISTGEFPWETFSDSNGRNRNNKPCKSCGINLGAQVGIDEWEAEDRNYILTGNPVVQPLKINGEVQEKFNLRIAVNTDQYGRTFQDRSHTFAIAPRPSGIANNVKIHNLNVRGKRGNIVQTYPATEYDFVPMRLVVQKGEAVHIQWTGSDDNPGNNAGQGQAGSDRSNMVQLRPPQYEDVINAAADFGVKHGHWGNSYPDHLKNTSFLGLSDADEKHLCLNGISHTAGYLDELDEASPNYNFGVRILNTEGVYRYMCTRNNNFSNRAQKGVVVVEGANSGKKDAKETTKNSVDESFAEELKDIENLENDIKSMLHA